METLQWLDCLVELPNDKMGVVVGVDHDTGMVQVAGAVQDDASDGVVWHRDASAPAVLVAADAIKLARPAKHQTVRVLATGARAKVTTVIEVDDEVVVTFGDNSANAKIMSMTAVGVLVE